VSHYEYLVHTNGEKYLVRLDEAGAVTGACGPLRQKSIPEANRQNFGYDDQPKQAAWIQLHRGEFQPVVAVPAPPTVPDERGAV
jgi:hypothetical protein